MFIWGPGIPWTSGEHQVFVVIKVNAAVDVLSPSSQWSSGGFTVHSQSCGWCVLVDETSPLNSLAARGCGKGQGGHVIQYHT